MKGFRKNKDELTPQAMLTMLNKEGVDVHPDEAKLILEFFTLLADILVEEFAE